MVFIALSAICLPFVTPALRRVCLPYVPATTTQLENIQSALKYHGSKPGTKSKLVDIGNFFFNFERKNNKNFFTNRQEFRSHQLCFQQKFMNNSDDNITFFWQQPNDRGILEFPVGKAADFAYLQCAFQSLKKVSRIDVFQVLFYFFFIRLISPLSKTILLQ